MVTDLGRWDPLQPPQVAALFNQLPNAGPWWFAGGYAIEMFVGRVLRQHGDIDVLLLRRDQQVVHQVLTGWDTHAADPPGHLRLWTSEEVLPAHVHDIWCREDPSGPWRVQVMLDEADGDKWYSRRNPSVSMAVSNMGQTNPDGWPYLAPEIQLFHKAKAGQQLSKDEIDFAAALPRLEPRARRWLDAALEITLPEHHWRSFLT